MLLWLRYSAFLVLYPVGVGSELTMAALALSQVITDITAPAVFFSLLASAPCLSRHSSVWSNVHVTLQIRRRKLLSLELPHALNWAFDYYTACIILMLVYFPGEFFVVMLQSVLVS